jgi:hypothetical protein
MKFGIIVRIRVHRVSVHARTFWSAHYCEFATFLLGRSVSWMHHPVGLDNDTCKRLDNDNWSWTEEEGAYLMRRAFWNEVQVKKQHLPLSEDFENWPRLWGTVSVRCCSILAPVAQVGAELVITSIHTSHFLFWFPMYADSLRYISISAQYHRLH